MMGIIFLDTYLLALFFKIFNLASNLWTVSVRTLIFCNKTLPLVPTFSTLWAWPWCLTNFLKTFSLLITFEQWGLELWYFTWMRQNLFVVTNIFYPVTLEFGLLFENFNLANNFLTVSARVIIFYTSIPCDNIFVLVLNLLTLTFDIFL